ncbi:hypothetical protein PRUPE_4G214900 [Prunus persica]|nr:hypothetical protein PRUPE_4G214900 [Prunus persica]
MENRYGLTTQGSGVWRALRDGDFEEEDVWEVLKDRNSSSNKMVGRSKESSVSVPRHLPTASRMIPKASSHNYGSGSSCSSSNTITHEAKIVQQSAPVNIPDWSEVYGQKSKKAPKNVSWQNDDADDEEEVGDDDGDSDDDDEEEEDYDSKVHQEAAAIVFWETLENPKGERNFLREAKMDKIALIYFWIS